MDSKLFALNLWPNPSFYGIPLSSKPSPMSAVLKEPIEPHYYGLNIRRYLFYYLLAIVYQLNLKLITYMRALDIAGRYLRQRKSYNKQVVLLTSLFLAAKLHEVYAFSLSLLHKYSDHSFTSKEVLKCYSNIIDSLQYKLLSDGYLLCYYVECLFAIICPLITLVEQNTHQKYIYVMTQIQKALFKYPPICTNKLLGPAIVVAALIILSQSNGRFPMLCRLSYLSGYTEENIQKVALKILKLIVGKELLKALNL